MTPEGTGSVVAGCEVEAAPLIIAIVKSRRTSALIAPDRVPTVRRTANVVVAALIVINALVPITMLGKGKKVEVQSIS